MAVAGCGGGGGEPPKKPTAAEIEAAETRWREQVDEVCLEVNREIGERGGAPHVDAIDRMVAEGVADVRAGIRAFGRAWREASRAHGRLRWRAGLPVKPAEDAFNDAQVS